jgi:LacI family transcriptional regulator
MEDVAAAAGVSLKTVSRVLNEEPNVREATRDRVLKAVEQLQYRPNLSARGLAGQRSYVVALVYDNPSRNYLMEVQSGMLDACRASHYHLVLAPVSAQPERKAADLRAVFENFAPDGVVLIPPLTDDVGLLDYLVGNEVPFASIAPIDAQGRIGAMMEETIAVRELVEGLVRLGHRRIAHILGPSEHGACQWRYEGYRQALAQAGITVDPTLVVQGAFSFESGVEAANRLLDLPEPPTAIFAANDDMAAGVIRAAAERGVAVPQALSVCGFDDTPIARQLYPTLSTVRQPTAEMAHKATTELLARIRSPQAGRMVRVEHEVLFRESTAPAAKTTA